MKKTKEEIRKETPLSVTTTDNAIFEVIEDCWVLLILNDQRNPFILKKGMKLRLLGCQVKKEWVAIPFRWRENAKVFVPVECVRYVSGNLGTRYKGEYEEE